MIHRPTKPAALAAAVAISACIALLSRPAHAQDESVTDDIRTRAEAGDAGAQFDLGRSYDNGEGVPQDHQEAARWYRLAAEQGHAPAQHRLASAYLRGAGVQHDYQEAEHWLRLAAEQGYTDSQSELGFLYAGGLYFPPDYEETVVEPSILKRVV